MVAQVAFLLYRYYRNRISDNLGGFSSFGFHCSRLMGLSHLLASPTALPSVPRVIAQLLNELERNEPDLRKMNQSLREDPVLTARVLRLVNSAQFNLAKPIGQVSEALPILGLAQVRNLVCSAAMASAFRQVGGVDMPQYWRCSLDTARLSGMLAGSINADAPSAFIAGLLHAVGELVMHLGLPREMAQLDSHIAPLDPGRAAAELALMGYCYAQVGAGLARAWHFPDALAEVLEHQAGPFPGATGQPLSAIVHVASWRTRARAVGLDDVAVHRGFPRSVALDSGLDIDTALQGAPIAWATRDEAAIFS